MEDIITNNILYIVRLLLACICGIAIGFERKEHSKEAGIRTHCVIACAAALMMIISKYGFADLPIGEMGVRGADPARIAAQVVSGVGFLGAGTIFLQRNVIKGLTTAAGMWVTAGVGMAIGAGMYIIGIASTVILLLCQVLLRIRGGIFKLPKKKVLSISEVSEENFKQKTVDMLDGLGVKVDDVNVSKHIESQTKDYKFFISIPTSVDDEKIIDLVKYSCSVKNIN